MGKQEFLSLLKNGLQGLPQKEIEEHLSFYGEMIDDRMEEGLSEAEAVSQIGTVNDVILQILEETSLTKLVKEKMKPKRALKAWETAFLIVGSPVWLALLIALSAVILAGYIVIWATLVSLLAVTVSVGVCSFVGTSVPGIFIIKGYWSAALATFGAGFFCSGLSIALSFGLKSAAKGVVKLTKKLTLGIKSLFIGGVKKNG